MSITEKSLRTREIITKAVCGKGRKFSQETHSITPANTPTSILGCWVINHSYRAEKVGDLVEVRGSYDINVWYSYENNTKTDVAKETVTYVDQVGLSYLDGNVRGTDLGVSALAIRQPSAVEAKVVGKNCAVQVEREFYCEVIGETKVNVVVAPDISDDEKDDKYEAIDEGAGDLEEIDPDEIIEDLD